MREVYIRSAACLVHNHTEDFSLVKQELERNSGKKFRRVNRFIILALASVYRFPEISQIDSECSLYLGTKHGCAADSFGMLKQMYQETLIPLPFTFINTSANMAGFYIAQSLGLLGENYTFSQPWGSFEKAFTLAYRDIRMGRNESALAGSCDEAVFLPEDVRHLLDMQNDDTLLEGGCWIHLSAHPDGASAKIRRECSATSADEFKAVFRSFGNFEKAVLLLDSTVSYESVQIDRHPAEVICLAKEKEKVIGSDGGKRLVSLLEDPSCTTLLYVCREGLSKYALWCIEKL